jgi:hypothetical protein
MAIDIRIDTTPLTRPGGLIDRDLEARAARVEAVASATAPVDTGRLAGSIVSRRKAHLVWEVVADTEYAIFVARRFMLDALKAAV